MNKFSSIVVLLKSKISHDSTAEMGWVLFGQLVTVALSFVIVKILSGMGTKDFGIYVLVLTSAAFLGIIYGPLQQAFIRFYYEYLNKNLIDQYLKTVFKYLRTISLIFLFLVIIFNFLSAFLIEFSEPILFFILAGIYIIAFKVSEFFNSGLNVIRRRKENSILQSLEKIFIIILLLLFLYSKSLTLTNAFISLNASVIVFLFIKIFRFRKYVPLKANLPSNHADLHIKNILVKYSTPFLIWAFAAWLQLNGEKWIINEILTTSDVGIYAMMMMIVNTFVSFPINIINEFITPIIFKQVADVNQMENFKTGHSYILVTIAVALLLTVFSTIFTYLFGKEFIIIISNKTYTLYWYLLPLLCLGTGLFYTGQAQTMLGMVLNKPQKYIAPKISAGVLSVVFNLFLIKYFGINGVAYSILLVGIFYIIYISLVNKSLTKALQET